ncbi:hypothetical protein TCSYLVIO_002098 [Trypanosoma cruzi]|nr:hypothetical protein TCSYLVIO_002098 [Trypanosoma cruzi]
MEGQKHDWSSAHAQLWTSFKKSQKGNNLCESNTIVSMDTVTPVSSVFEQNPTIGRDLTSSILDEVKTRTRLDEPVLSNKLEDQIIGLVEDVRTDASVRELLSAIIQLKNRVEKANNEAVYRQDSLLQVADETLFHLNGQKNAAIAPEEMVTEGTGALGVIESRFFAVLIQVEKCKKAIMALAEKNGLNKTLSGNSSMREVLEFLTSSKMPVSEGAEIDNEENAMLHQVMDILGIPSGTSLDQAPDLALKVMKELEFLREENHTNSLLILQYERTVMAKFASCGVVSPPTVEQERAALLSEREVLYPHSDNQWIKDHLRSLVSVMTEVNKNYQLDVVPNWLLGGPQEASAEAFLNYMRTSIGGARELLILLARDLTEAKHSLLEVPQNEETLNMMMRIVSCLPEGDQIKIREMKSDLDSLADYVEDAVKSLVMASSVQEHMYSRVKTLISQIAYLKDIADGGGHNALDQATLSSIVGTAEDLRVWVTERYGVDRRTEDAIIQESLHELAQLLPTGLAPSCTVGEVRIDPPVNNILDMVRLLKSRIERWIQEQQKQQLSGARSRLGKARVEEIVRERSKKLVRITKEILLSSGNSSETEDILGALSAELMDGPTNAVNGGNDGNNNNSNNNTGGEMVSVATVFDDLEERLKLVKVRHHRLFQSCAADKVRLENLIQSSNAHNKRFSRICTSVGAICRTVGLEQIGSRIERDSKAETVSSSSQLVLRPEQRRENVVQPVNDAEIIEALRLIEERLVKNEAIVDSAQQKSELLRLKEEEKHWQEETGTFRQAMQMILVRLAEAGRRIKCTLFMLGTDESAEDEVVESVIRQQQRSLEEEGADNNYDSAGEQRQHEVSEESLAVLLQKFGRWATRLQEATEDHLYTQQKLNKYFADVHRLFCPTGDAAVAQQNTTDENLIDIDTTLMHFADGILPVIDRALADAEASSNNNDAGGKGAGCEDGVRSKAISILLQDAPQNRVSHMDHRLVRLYEFVGKLRTIVDGLLSVRYLSIPLSSRRRGGNAADELIFEDAWGDSYVELDVGKMKCATTTDKGDNDALNMSDDMLFRTVESNIRSVHQALSKFSTNYKLAVILVQKDTDMMQQFIASMLEPYVELDLERVFRQDPVVLKEMFALLNERTARQRGCYFFNRVGGEGPCLWATALEQLSLGFLGIIEKLRKRTQVAMELRDIVDDAVDLCAMYVNWVELNGEAILSLCPLPQEVVEACVREENDADVEGHLGQLKQQRGEKKLPKPPLPPNHPRSKVSHFVEDTIILRVIAHMFQVAQAASKNKEGQGDNDSGKMAGENSDGIDATDEKTQEKQKRKQHQQEEDMQQLEEQLQLLRESAAVAEQRANSALESCKRMEQERDRALSEAAVSRAELRRWRRFYGIAEDKVPPLSQQHQHNHQVIYPAALTGTASSVDTPEQNAPSSSLEMGSNSSLPNYPAKDVLSQLAYSMKELTEELRGAFQRGAVLSHQGTAGTNSATVEAHLDGLPRAAGNSRERMTARKQSQRNTASRSSGLVRSPKEGMEVASQGRCMSPLSASSSLLPPSTRDSRSPLGNNTCSHKMQSKRQQRDVRQGPLLAPCASVVVTPKKPTYLSLARAHSNTTLGATRAPSAPRYQPNLHRSEYFNECDACCRHHRSVRSTKIGVDTVPLASSRSRSPNLQLTASASRGSHLAGPSTRHLKQDEKKVTARQYQHDRSSSVRRSARLSRSSTGKISLYNAAEDTMRTSSAVREHPAAASASSSLAATAHGEKHNRDHHGRAGPKQPSHFSLSPSTSTVLSPESTFSPTDAGAEQYQQQYNHSQHQQCSQKQQQEDHHQLRMTSRPLKEFQGVGGASLGTSLETIGQHTGPKTSPHPALHKETVRRTARDTEQQTRQLNYLNSKDRIKAPQSANLRSDAVRKLADIVSRTKVSGDEEL